jgi:hypothetical protein
LCAAEVSSALAVSLSRSFGSARLSLLMTFELEFCAGLRNRHSIAIGVAANSPWARLDMKESFAPTHLDGNPPILSSLYHLR